MHFCQLTPYVGKSGGKPLTLTPGICLAWVSFICSEVARLVLHLYLLFSQFYFTSLFLHLCFPSNPKQATCMWIMFSGSPFGEMKKKIGRGEMSYYWLSFRHNHWLRLCLVPIHHIIFINENSEAGCTKYSSSHPSQLILTRILTITFG